MNICRLYLNIYLLAHCMIYLTRFNFVNGLHGNVRQAEEDEFPSVVSISMIRLTNVSNEQNHRCTATIITQQDVLTAEHCLRDLDVSGFKIMMGNIDLAHCIEMYSLWWFSYDHWAVLTGAHFEFHENDIAIIKLIGNAPDHIPVAPVLDAPSNSFYGLETQLATWGRLSNNQIPRIMHTGTVRVLSRDNCMNIVSVIRGGMMEIHERRICTIADPPIQLVNGDSGGPLLYFGGVVGINKGTCPFYGDLIPESVNIHFGAYFYRNFIIDMMTNYQVQF